MNLCIGYSLAKLKSPFDTIIESKDNMATYKEIWGTSAGKWFIDIRILKVLQPGKSFNQTTGII